MIPRLILCFLIAAQFFNVSNSIASEKRRLWIDLDISAGIPFHDVDDGYALAYALSRSHDFQIVGLSTVYGNLSQLDLMEPIIQNISELLGRTPPPVYRGSFSASDLGIGTSATRALASALESAPLTIVSIGPATNIGTLVRLRPDLVERIDELVFAGGRKLENFVRLGTWRARLPDTNIDHDLRSIQAILNSGVNLTLIPTEAMRNQLITRRTLRQMSNSNFPALQWLSKKSHLWRKLWTVFPGLPGFIPFDLFAVTYLVHPEDFRCTSNVPVAIKTLPNDGAIFFPRRNRQPFKPFLVVSEALTRTAKAKYCDDIDSAHLSRVFKEDWTASIP